MANHRAFNSVITAGNGVHSELSSFDTSWSRFPDQVPILGSLLQSGLWECSRRVRLWILDGLTITISAALWYVPPIPLWSGYHDFADKRTLFLIPNCLDVLSNLPWLLVGVFAIFYLAHKPRGSFDNTYDEIPYFFYFVGVGLTGIGSAYYHLAPSNFRLIWDLLPMTVSFVALVSATVVERISRRAGLLLLFPLIAFGIGSVVYWYTGELNGHGDLRFYLFVQFAPAILIGTMIVLFPSRYTGTKDLFVVFLLFVAAKVCESFDVQIYTFHQIVSGHTLKHLIGGLASYWMLRMLELRGAVRPAQRSSGNDGFVLTGVTSSQSTREPAELPGTRQTGSCRETGFESAKPTSARALGVELAGDAERTC